jgi:hypothetical protein
MVVAVVEVRIMGVAVRKSNMLVQVAMRLGQRRCASMLMKVVFIMHVAVLMRQHAVLMSMPVPFSQIKHNTGRCQ